MKIIECTIDAQIKATHPLLQQLYGAHIIPDMQNYLIKVREMLARNYRQIIAIKSDICVGTAIYIYFPTFDVGELPYVQDLVVDEKYRGQGIGTALLAWISNEARERGCQYISLNAEKQDIAAQEYYQRMQYIHDANYYVKKL